VGEGDGLGLAETIFGWIKLEENSNREITANTATPKKIFLNLSICDPFNCFYWKISSIFQDAFQNLLKTNVICPRYGNFIVTVSLDTNRLK